MSINKLSFPEFKSIPCIEIISESIIKCSPEEEIINAITILQSSCLDFTHTINILNFAHAEITSDRLREKIKVEIYGSKS